jgi:transcription antitermination factor NusG
MFSQDLHVADMFAVNRSTEHPWYVLRVKTNREKSTAYLLRQKGYIDFLPLHTQSRRWSDRLKEMQLPLFPGYVFCRFDPRHRLPILTTPGVLHAVGIGGMPEPVNESEIAALQVAVASGRLLQPWPFLKIGERVIIQHGPLRQMEGILSEVRGDRKLIISITLLQRSVAVQIERADVRPAAA